MSPSMTPTSQATSSSSSSAPPPVPPRPGSGVETAANVATRGGGAYRPGYASAYGGAGMGMGYPYSTPSYGMMGSNYSPYASGGYGAYGSGYGSGYGYGAAGAGAVDSPLIRLAEENSRPAFETIQAIVHTFGSVHMMFESTYLALHSSFRAVLGVVEHMTRMRAQLSHFLSAFAALRYIRWLYGRLRRLATGREEETVGTDLDGAFASSSSAAAGSPGDGGGGGVNWPIVIYMGLVVAAPYLMWKLMASVVNLDRKRDLATKEGEEDAPWLEGRGEHFEAVAEHDFRGQSDSELTFSSGQPLVLAPKHRQPRVRGWLLAGLKGQGKRQGLVPANHIKILGRRQGVGEAAATPPADRPDVVMNGSTGQEEDLEGAFK